MARSSITAPTGDGSLQNLPLNLLHLDHQNPRFGGRNRQATDEDQLLDEIVGQHGITDVISSIAANSYFESEPLVGAINKGHGNEVTIVEGNRRLCACLILAKDPRSEAPSLEKIRERFSDTAFKSDSLLPVQVYDWNNPDHRKRLLPYLGVRHIVGAAQWDSYAKAAWVAETISSQAMTLDEIRLMIGDSERFTDRIVEGYYFVEQLESTNTYDAADSNRRGRGSFQAYPFSWVYTALGYNNVRKFLGLSKDFAVQGNPIEDEYLEKSGKFLQYMFGGAGRNAAIDDSRKIGKLAKALSDERAIEALDEGFSAEDALERLRPVTEQLLLSISRANRSLAEAITCASGLTSLSRDVWVRLSDDISIAGTRIDNLGTMVDKLKSSPSRQSRKTSDSGE